jgi:phospholipase C
MSMRKRLIVGAVATAALAGTTAATARPAVHDQRHHGSAAREQRNPDAAATRTPIKHVVVIFQENVSFDHYFATYPNATNPGGEPAFTAARGTPSVNGLDDPLDDPNNPNSTQPFRLSRAQAQTCDQDHTYTGEQKAFHSGLMDLFPETVGRPVTPGGGSFGCPDYGKGSGLVMGYYDGNTVTAMWNYAQHFAMSDNSYNTTFGPSTPGALNLISGQTHGFVPTLDKNGAPAPALGEVTENGTVIGDPQPSGDKCNTRDNTTAAPSNKGNVGDRLNAKHVSWGWFQGGFRDCAQTHSTTVGTPQTTKDYIPHHEPFQYYQSTANPQHTPPASAAEIGHDGTANHQYDLSDFWTAVDRGSMPAVSFVKAAAYQDGHAGYSNPLDEQHFLVDTINRLQRGRDWKDTAVVVAYDDSDGWYDHQMSPIVNQSTDPKHDGLTDALTCGNNAKNVAGGYQDRCGYGPRLPLLVISPYAKRNYVDHATTDQSSILRFVEDNWDLGRIGDFSFDAKAGSLGNLFAFGARGEQDRRSGGTLILDPQTGQPAGRGGH